MSLLTSIFVSVLLASQAYTKSIVRTDLFNYLGLRTLGPVIRISS